MRRSSKRGAFRRLGLRTARAAARRCFAPAISLSIAIPLALLSCGCGTRPSDADPRALRIASDWSKPDRDAIAREFAASGPPIVWTEWDDPAEPIDVFLGGPTSVYAGLASKGLLERLGGDGPSWTTARRSFVGMTGTKPSTTTLADPRADPLTRVWALGRLQDDGWSVAYAKLIDAYGRARPAGWRNSSARAAVARGDADATIDRRDDPASVDDSVVFEEGAGIRRGSRRMESAHAFLRFLDARRGVTEASNEQAKSPLSPEAEALASDLLGATLVDAQDELRKAIEEVDKAGSPAGAVSRLTPLPPWPPASVEKLLRKGGEESATLIETLSAQIAPEPGARLWLSQSWLRPRRSIDGELLSELAEVERGGLAREPRFRAWLRAEWTQWARQRYRWVARLAASRSPLLTSTRSSEP